MATKAYILIKVKTGRTKDVLQALKKLAGVEQAHSCFGQPDIFLFISTQDERSLSDVVTTSRSTRGGWSPFGRRIAGPTASARMPVTVVTLSAA